MIGNYQVSMMYDDTPGTICAHYRALMKREVLFKETLPLIEYLAGSGAEQTTESYNWDTLLYWILNSLIALTKPHFN